MSVVKRLDRYSAFLYPGTNEDVARINLYCGDYKLYVLFKDTETLPRSSFNSTSKVGVAFWRSSQYAPTLDLIRNEGPISVTFNPEATPPSFVIYAATEPPGEGEL